MKCMFKSGQTIRVSDESAKELSAIKMVSGRRGPRPWRYMQKEEYKRIRSDLNNSDIVSVEKGHRGELFDATGKALFEPFWANLKTGEALHHARDKDGEFIIVKDSLKTEMIKHPAPLKYVPAKNL